MATHLFIMIFRADRAVEIATAFTEKKFDKFDRSGKTGKARQSSNTKAQAVDGKLRVGVDTDLSNSARTSNPENPLPDIFFAGLTEYDADRHIPKNILVPPVKIENPLNTFLGSHKFHS